MFTITGIRYIRKSYILIIYFLSISLLGFEEIRIGVRYIYKGEELSIMPASLGIYSDVEVEYEVLPGWTEDISKISKFEDLPTNCQRYVLRLEEVSTM